MKVHLRTRLFYLYSYRLLPETNLKRKTDPFNLRRLLTLAETNITKFTVPIVISLHYHTKLHYSQTSNLKLAKFSRANRKMPLQHRNFVLTISLHIQNDFARVFINNYSFRKLFYCIRHFSAYNPQCQSFCYSGFSYTRFSNQTGIIFCSS